MATQKSTQTTLAASVTCSANDVGMKKLRECITENDSVCQSAHRTIASATASILLMLREPDSPALRLNIKALCLLIDNQSLDCMNSVNAAAEDHGAHFVDLVDRDDDRLICAAAYGQVQGSQAVQS